MGVGVALKGIPPVEEEVPIAANKGWLDVEEQGLGPRRQHADRRLQRDVEAAIAAAQIGQVPQWLREIMSF